MTNQNLIYTVTSEGYYIHNLAVPTQIYNIGKYGRLHKESLKQNHRGIYSAMMIEGTLLEYLSNIDTQAKNEVDKILKIIAEQHGISEELKAVDQLKWIGEMNNILHLAEEIIFQKIIYSLPDIR